MISGYIGFIELKHLLPGFVIMAGFITIKLIFPETALVFETKLENLMESLEVYLIKQ